MWCFGGDREKLVDPLLEAFRVLLPQQIVQEDAHGVHAQAFGPAEFLVDLLRIEGVRLPHLQLVDGAGRNVVRAHQPRLLLIPGVGLFFGPALRGLCQQQSRKTNRRQYQPHRNAFHEALEHSAPDYSGTMALATFGHSRHFYANFGIF